MYIQITTKCNMACEHCCFACNKTEGDHMDIQTFFKAVAFAEEYGENITLGGGEPTIHPRFWEFFGIALGSDAEHIWMATNGKKPDIAAKLADIAMESERFDIALSQDVWHDPIKPETVTLFKNLGHEIRSVDGSGKYGNYSISNVGAAEENGIGTNDDCACRNLHINPDGTIKICGCLDSLVLGHVNDIDDTIITRASEVGNDILGTECGRNLDQEYIDYIIDNTQFNKKEAA